MTFQNSRQPSEQIYKESKIFKLRDSVTISNLELVYEQMKKILPMNFRSFFVNKTNQSLYNTRGSTFEVSQVKTATYGSNSLMLHAIRAWDFFQNKVKLLHCHVT